MVDRKSWKVGKKTEREDRKCVSLNHLQKCCLGGRERDSSRSMHHSSSSALLFLLLHLVPIFLLSALSIFLLFVSSLYLLLHLSLPFLPTSSFSLLLLPVLFCIFNCFLVHFSYMLFFHSSFPLLVFLCPPQSHLR